MEIQIETKATAVEKELFIKMTISAWEAQNVKINKLLSTLTDEQLAAETAPGRNTGIYILGHLAVITDALLPLFGLGERHYPHLDNLFLHNPEKNIVEKPSAADVRKYWHATNANIKQGMDKMHPDEWFKKHSAVSEEDFKREPHRNKLNVLMNRTNHTCTHLGQLIYLEKK